MSFNIWDHAITVDMTKRYFSRRLQAMSNAEVYLLRPLDNRDKRWGRMLRTGTKVAMRVGPFGEGKLLTADNFGTVLFENGVEGRDFSFDPVTLPVTMAFACSECGKREILTLDDDYNAEQLLCRDATYDAYNLGGGGKRNRGLKALGWILEKAKFFSNPTRLLNGAPIRIGDQVPLLACSECAEKVTARKAATKLENARLKLERAQRALEKAKEAQ